MARGRRKCPENGHRVHAGRILIAMANSDGLVVPVAIRDGETICEKDQIKPATLENACDLDVVLGRTARDAPGCATGRGCAPPGLRSGNPQGAFDAGLGSCCHSSFARSFADRAHPAKASREHNSEQRLRFYLTSSINIIEYRPRRHQVPGERASRIMAKKIRLLDIEVARWIY